MDFVYINEIHRHLPRVGIGRRSRSELGALTAENRGLARKLALTQLDFGGWLPGPTGS